VRIVEPHCHGISRTGKEVLRGYQTGGFSSSGRAVGWRLFEVWKTSGLQRTGEIFVGIVPDTIHATGGCSRCIAMFKEEGHHGTELAKVQSRYMVRPEQR
jgi:hypothetical protein